MALYIPHSIFHSARLLYVRPETFGPYYVHTYTHTYTHGAVSQYTAPFSWSSQWPSIHYVLGSNPTAVHSSSVKTCKLINRFINILLDECGTGYGSVMGCYVHGSEHTGSIVHAEFD